MSHLQAREDDGNTGFFNSQGKQQRLFSLLMVHEYAGMVVLEVSNLSVFNGTLQNLSN